MNPIKTTNLTKTYSGTNVVDSLSLELLEGSITGMLGRNGAGKTTTIKLMAGLILPSHGNVTLNGVDPFLHPEVRIENLFLLDSGTIPSHLTVMEYLVHLSRIYRFDQGSIRDSLEKLELWDYRNYYPSQLSAGMKQKAYLSLFLCRKFQTVVADEPAANLDPRSREDLYELIRATNREQGTTFLISSHILMEMRKLIDSVVVIKKGRVTIDSRMDNITRDSTSGKRNIFSIEVSDTQRASSLIAGARIQGKELIVERQGNRIGDIIDTLESGGLQIFSVNRTSDSVEKVLLEAM